MHAGYTLKNDAATLAAKLERAERPARRAFLARQREETQAALERADELLDQAVQERAAEVREHGEAPRRPVKLYTFDAGYLERVIIGDYDGKKQLAGGLGLKGVEQQVFRTLKGTRKNPTGLTPEIYTEHDYGWKGHIVVTL